MLQQNMVIYHIQSFFNKVKYLYFIIGRDDKRLKKFIITCFTVMFLSTSNVYADNKYNNTGITIYVNEHSVFKEENIILRNNRALIKYNCGIFEALGYTTNYDIVNREVIIKDGKDITTTFLNDYIIYRNGIASYTADVRSDVIEKQVYIPLRGFIESLDGSINWNDNTKEIFITIKPQ